jgi:hypothetical protein
MIAGRAGVGKTTLAKMIAEEAFELGLLPQLVSFAGPVKAMAEQKGYFKREHPKKYRKFCQEYGGRYRETDPDHWVKKFEKKLLSTIKKEAADLRESKKYWERCVIVDDCRYLNEVGLGMKYNANLLFLSYGNRDVPDGGGGWRNHHSEELADKMEASNSEYTDMFTHVITNEEGIDDLYLKANAMTPLWCGLEADADKNCPCESCRAKREGRPANKDQCVSDLIDLLLFNKIQEDEDEDEEDTDDSIS